jgi:hypothetical protein
MASSTPSLAASKRNTAPTAYLPLPQPRAEHGAIRRLRPAARRRAAGLTHNSQNHHPTARAAANAHAVAPNSRRRHGSPRIAAPARPTPKYMVHAMPAPKSAKRPCKGMPARIQEDATVHAFDPCNAGSAGSQQLQAIQSPRGRCMHPPGHDS